MASTSTIPASSYVPTTTTTLRDRLRTLAALATSTVVLALIGFVSAVSTASVHRSVGLGGAGEVVEAGG